MKSIVVAMMVVTLYGFGSLSCKESCTVQIQGRWLEPASFCPTEERIVGCSSRGANLAGSCYIYLPTGRPVVVDQQQPPIGDPAFPGDWRECTPDEFMRAFDTGKMCGSDAATD